MEKDPNLRVYPLKVEKDPNLRVYLLKVEKRLKYKDNHDDNNADHTNHDTNNSQHHTKY